jgi:hypothetical protein
MRLSRQPDEEEEVDDDRDVEEDVVEMCAGWVMIPILDALRDNVRKKKIEMYGGTPFAVVQINKKEIVKRPGAWNDVKRLFGKVQTRSKLEVIMTPVGVVGDPSSKPMAPTSHLTSLLPPNVVLPTSSLSLAGIYRATLAQSFTTFQIQNDERMLPQTGIGLPMASAVLSGFPRLLSDYAAQMVLLWMWGTEFRRLLGPTAGTSAFLAQLTVGAATSPQAMDLFREVVLRVWRASNSPDALPDKMQPVETIEAIYTRVHCMKRAIAGEGNGTGTGTGTGTGVGVGVGNVPGALTASLATGLLGSPLLPPSPASASSRVISATTRGVAGSSRAIGGLAASMDSLRMSQEVKARRANDALVAGRVLPNTGARLEQAALAPQLHTPFNARELMWQAYQNT